MTRPGQIPPMIPAAAALAAGIVVSWYFMLPVRFTAAAAAVCAVTAAVAVDRSRAAGVAALAAVLFLGMTASGMRPVVDVPDTARAVCDVEITGHVAFRDGWLRTSGELRARRSADGVWHGCRGRVVIAADSASGIRQGDRVVCRTRIVPFDGSSEGYGGLMRRRGYAGRLFIAGCDVLSRQRCAERRLIASLHERAVRRMAQLPLEGRSLAVATALGTGDRSLLDRELRGEYSRAGMAHVLALSGLHVGIVLLLVDALLFWMPLLPAGHKLRCVAAVALLWGYVAVTGMAPSAVRAAMMFSALQLSRLFSARYSGANALAAAAFVCMCHDPELLRDPGFQLSYAAVAGILAWGVPLCRLLHVPYDGRRHDLRGRVRNAACAALNMLTETVAVGLTASLAAAPLVSHLFGAVPVAGPLTSPAAVAAAAVVVLLSAVWLVVPFDAPAPLFGRVAEFAADVLNALSERVSGLAWSAFDVRLDGWQTVAAYAVMAAATAMFAGRRGDKGREWSLNEKKS
ncbi:MAG: ComEC/Rec2 family competence protein [Alistipes sp.]|nr:ComEC/Rec2 family competence protein [Alistipes sp.]